MAKSSHNRILLGLLVGVVAGLIANWLFANQRSLHWVLDNITEPVGQLFLRLLLMTVIPLVFSSLIVGLAGIGDIRSLGRVGIRCVAYCLVISAISVGIGLTLANTIQPGKRINPETAKRLQERYQGDAATRVQETQKTAAKDSVPLQFIKGIVPANPIAAVATETPNMLHLLFFSVMLGVALLMLPIDKSAPLLSAMEALAAASAKLIDIIMRVAPIAVACLLFNNTARFGIDVLQALGWFVLTVITGLALHLFGTYSLAVRSLSGLAPREFFRRIKLVIVTAFSTSSSNATLPTTLKAAEENLGVPRKISSFVLTIGATANQNGTALYEGVTVLFLAQVAGVDLTLGQQVLVAYLAILGSIGTAGVPSGSIPFIIVVLSTINVNPLLIGVILGVDRILDMCRTIVNVVGDLTAATYVARAEGVLNLPPDPR
jgi:dicarboxylate/amino acid:cation (Na+ or H+) symporter, DAACS family